VGREVFADQAPLVALWPLVAPWEVAIENCARSLTPTATGGSTPPSDRRHAPRRPGVAEVVAVQGARDAEADRRDQAAPREENGAGHPEAEVFRGAEDFPEA
jgi:hypothetical protein